MTSRSVAREAPDALSTRPSQPTQALRSHRGEHRSERSLNREKEPGRHTCARSDGAPEFIAQCRRDACRTETEERAVADALKPFGAPANMKRSKR